MFLVKEYDKKKIQFEIKATFTPHLIVTLMTTSFTTFIFIKVEGRRGGWSRSSETF